MLVCTDKRIETVFSQFKAGKSMQHVSELSKKAKTIVLPYRNKNAWMDSLNKMAK